MRALGAAVAGRGAVRADTAREHVERLHSEHRFIGPVGAAAARYSAAAVSGTPQLEHCARSAWRAPADP